MKSEDLLVQVPGIHRNFYLYLPKGKTTYYIKFAPPQEVREKLGIKRVDRTTGFDYVGPAQDKAREIILEYFPNRETREVVAIAKAKEKNRADFATLGEIIQRYWKGVRTIQNKEETVSETIKQNIRCLRLIVETRFDEKGERTRKEGTADAMRVDKALDPELWEKFKLGWLRSVKQDNIHLLQRAKRSINSNIAQARSLFHDDFLPLYKGLRLPDLSEFRKVKTYSLPRKKPIPLDGNVLDEVSKKINELRTERPDFYLAFYFALYLGMRRREIHEAKLGWIVQTPTGPEMAIRVTEDGLFAPKGTEDSVPMPEWLLNDIRELSGATKANDYLIPAKSHHQRKVTVRKKLTAWLHRYMPDRLRPLHELRAMACALQLLENDGNILKAKAFMRHSDIKTTMIYAGMIGKPKAIQSHKMVRVLPDVQKVA
jgi:integrase